MLLLVLAAASRGMGIEQQVVYAALDGWSSSCACTNVFDGVGSMQHGKVAMLSLDGYVRVSRVGLRRGERFISREVQREQIESWAAMRGARLLEVIEELDTPGRASKRPGLARAIERIEDGTWGGLVVWRVSRFGRSLIDGLTTIERIREAGGTFFSVADGLDTGTETGRLVLRIMLSMAEWELEGIRATWELAREKAVDRGVYCGRYPPPGYRRASSGRLTPDERVAAVIREVFERRANGETLTSLARLLEQRGVPTAAGNRVWGLKPIGSLLSNRVYLGEVRNKDHVGADAHAALVDHALWERAQNPRRPAPRIPKYPALLTGLLRCAGCGKPMVVSVHRERGPGQRMYGCSRVHAAGRCPAPATVAGVPLEACVEDVVFYLLERRHRPPMARAKRATDGLREAQVALASYRDDDRLRRMLGNERFAEGLAVRVDRVRVAAVELDAPEAGAAVHRLPATSELEHRWPDMSMNERRDLIAAVVDCVIVHRAPSRAHRSVNDRVFVCPAGTGPRPQRKRRKEALALRDYSAEHWAAHLGRQRATRNNGQRPYWTDTRIRDTLMSICTGRRLFPTEREFAERGLVGMHAAMGPVRASTGGRSRSACRGRVTRPARH